MIIPIKIGMIKGWKSCFNCVHKTSVTFRGARSDRCLLFYYKEKELAYHQLTTICRTDERKCGIAGKFYAESKK